MNRWLAQCSYDEKLQEERLSGKEEQPEGETSKSFADFTLLYLKISKAEKDIGIFFQQQIWARKKIQFSAVCISRVCDFK